jgi:uncharacterized protein YaeQ
MALKATIFKAVLSVSDMDRQYYATHSLVLARTLTVINLSTEDTLRLQSLVGRSMQLQCSIDGGHIWLSGADASAEITPVVWKS